MRSVGIALIFNKQQKILIGRRASNVPFTGSWEFPGGKLEKGETPQEALKRELMEELNVKSTINDFFSEIIYSYPSGKYKLLTYFTDIDTSTLELRVHDKIKFVYLTDLHKYKLLPSGMIMVKELIAHFNM